MTMTPTPDDATPAPWLGLDAARAAVAGALDDCLRKMLADPGGAHAPLVLRVSAGVGKTRALVEALARHGGALLRHGHVLVHAPTLALAGETHAAFKAIVPHLPSMALRGRSAANPDGGGRMCVRWELAERLSGLTGSVRDALCETRTAGNAVERAPCRHGCAYFSQRPTTNSVIFLAHAYLATGAPVAGRTALQVIDEKCWAAAIRTRHIPAGAWLAGRTPPAMSPARAAEARAAVLAAVMAGASPIDALRRLGITQADVLRLARAQTAALARPACSPGMRDDAIGRAIELVSRDKVGEARVRRGIWRRIAARWTEGATERLSYGADPQGARPPGLTLHERRPFDASAPAILLDADADPAIIGAIAPGARTLDICVRPHATVIQVRDRTLSTASLTSGDRAQAMRDGVASWRMPSAFYRALTPTDLDAAVAYARAAGTLSSEFESMTFGNILLGGVIGIAVDAASGAPPASARRAAVGPRVGPTRPRRRTSRQP
jgi:hypothetical protein